MHLYTHVRPEMLGRSGISEFADGMLEHDDDVGKLLKALDDLGIADNTIVVYSTDNGPHMNSWPDGGMTPFRSEKNTNWEGAFRVPAMVRWPGHIKPGSVSNEMISGLDWFPTLLAAAGDTGVRPWWRDSSRRSKSSRRARSRPASVSMTSSRRCRNLKGADGGFTSIIASRAVDANALTGPMPL